MNVRGLLLICFFTLLLATGLQAQNLFPVTIDMCSKEQFCMDCGTPKARVDSFTLAQISDRINYRYNFKNGSGSITFQVLVDAVGFSCVLSHTDVTNSQLTKELIVALNTCIWRPARVDGKKVNASVNVIFTIANGKISGKMQRVDLSQIAPADSAIVYNKRYPYTNPSLNNYSFSVFTKYNSPLPDNISHSCVLDKSDILWYATSHGLTKFNGSTFTNVDETNSPFTTTTEVKALASDKDDNTWMYANRAIYMYNKTGWKIFDSTHVGISNAYKIVANPSGEVFFTNKKGLLILRGEKIRMIDKSVIWQLPSNDVYYAYYDSKERLWIGTFKGSLMIDKKQKITVFNDLKSSPLKNLCITGVTEDEKGNVYLSTFGYKNASVEDNDEEGLIVMHPNGTWDHFTDRNSGLPSNTINNMLYDKFEHVLWLGTHQSGLVRFDLKTGWETYNNNNSKVPGHDIYEMAQDSKGTIYASTVNGLLMIRKK